MPSSSLARRRHRSRGQSLVEFALLVPVLLLILLLSIDFGRAFYSWVILQNAARIGANFAGLNAQAWDAPQNTAVIDEYFALVNGEVDGAVCTDPDVRDPDFNDSPADTSATGQTPDTSYNVGDTARVELTCVFHPLTPVVSIVVSTNVTLGASSEFRIRAGQIAGLDDAPPIPVPSIATPTPVPTATPTGTPGPCTVTAAFTRNPNAGSVANGTDIAFTNTSTASGCAIVSYAWNFGTGTPSTTTGVGPHTIDFSTTGSTTVTLTITTDTGATRVANDSFTVRRP